jgi:hypothetical protein
VDSDRKLSFAKFDVVVGVFRRPYVDGERDGGDKNEDCDESSHGETPLMDFAGAGWTVGRNSSLCNFRPAQNPSLDPVASRSAPGSSDGSFVTRVDSLW